MENHCFTTFAKKSQVTSGNRSIRIRAKSSGKVKDWVASINDAALRPPEGWCHPHRFGSFAPPRGLTDDGSQAQWFVDGGAAFSAIAAAIENAKSEVCHLPLQGVDAELKFLFIYFKLI